MDVSSVADQMKIFDTLGSADARVTVIDVRAGLLSSTLQALSDIGFIESASKGQITFAVFHILGPSIASLDEIAETAGFVGDASYFLVKNRINDTTFFEWDPATYNSYFKQIKGAAEITIPKLNEMACEQVEVASEPFVSFIANKNAKGEAGQLFLRAARLCAALARQCLGRIRPGEADRPRRAESGTRPARPRASARDMSGPASKPLRRRRLKPRRRADRPR